MDNGIYITKTSTPSVNIIKLSHFFDGELVNILFDQGDPLTGNLYVGRVSAKEGPSFWVNIGFQKPALLQRPRKNYQVGQRVLVQLKRPPFIEKYIQKNAEVSDAISISGAFLYYTPGKKGINFSSQIRDKDWRIKLLEELGSVTQEGEGVVLKGCSYGVSKDIVQDLHDVRQKWTSFQESFKKSEKIGTIIHKRIRPWISYAFENYKEPLYTDNADLVIELKKANIFDERITFSTNPSDAKSSWSRELDFLWDGITEEQVPLREGGYLLIEEGHTLTAIDVNTAASGDSKITRAAKVNSDIARFEFAQDALNEAIRQLYLRKIGGIVVIDLPRLSNPKHQKALLKTAKGYEDSNLQVLGFTKSGLLELTKRKDELSLKAITGGINDGK